ncbi:MAG: MBL fold metallo-hydrolase [Pseudomonadota bacterium]
MSDEAPPVGKAVEMQPGLRRVLAPNPSPMTHWGTNTYLIGTGEVAVVDPGPEDAGHLAAILAAVGGARVSHILVTHAHRDHSPLAAALSRETGAPVLAYGSPEEGRSAVMQSLSQVGLEGGEGVDTAFTPNDRLRDGDRIKVDGIEIDVIETPGHVSGHLAFALGDALLSGDHVMGWASTLISPPDGDLAAFMASCAKLRDRGEQVYFPGHGAPVPDPAARLDWLIAHRKGREAAILEHLSAGPATLSDLTARIYTDTPRQMWPVASRNVLAHLIDLHERGGVRAVPAISLTAVFTLA